ncbi:MAG TPA: hypothetical protein VF543_19425 [Pyrinomonadaceae bacterium]|jgi:hypothetical protein
MSLLAGFDFVSEISNATLLALIKSNMTIGGVQVNPPFEVTVPFAGASAHMIVDDLTLDLNDDDTMSLNFAFSQSSVTVQAPVPRVICPLAGNMSVRIPLTLVPSGGNTQQVSANMGAATVTLSMPQSEQTITNALAGTNITSAQFQTMALQGVTDFVRSVPNVSFPLSFNVVPNVNGSIAPLQFSSLQVHCIGNSNRSLQALGLFGNLLASTQNNGNHTEKTSTAIQAGRDAAVSFSPGAFHSLIFCPAVGTALGMGVGSLPPSCGGSTGGVSVNGIKLMSISDSFGNGQININGSVKDSGFCYDASGTFSGNIKLSVNGNALTPSISMDEPDVTIDIPFLCYLAAGVVLGPIGVATLFVIDHVADDIADKIAGTALNKALGGGVIGAVGLSALSGSASFASLSITPEGLTLQGNIKVSVKNSSFKKSLLLKGSTTTSSENIASSGKWHTQIWCKPAKDYPYTEILQNQVATYDVTSQLMATPLSVSYTLRSITSPVAIPLTGTSGAVDIPDVTCTYAAPLSTGGAKVTQSVHLEYQLNGTALQLRNRPEDGNFAVYLEATVRDCTGAVVTGGSSVSPKAWVYFDGNAVVIGGGYEADYQECAAQMKELGDKIKNKYKPEDLYVEPWVPINFPPEYRVYEQIRVLKAMGVREAQEMILHSRLAHGSGFTRAFHAPADVRTGRETRASQEVDSYRITETEIRSQLVMLTNQLLQMQRGLVSKSSERAPNKRSR